MSLYRTIATAVGTREALDLANRLAAWHDPMVMHRRRAGEAAGPACDVDCPHDQAESLWLEAVDVHGERAHAFAFLHYERRVMRLAFVLTSIVLALALGIVAGASESRLLTRTLVIGLVPATWAVSHVLARLIGRDLWHFAAPYPYRRMRDGAETALSRPDVRRESVHELVETDERSPLPFAA